MTDKQFNEIISSLSKIQNDITQLKQDNTLLKQKADVQRIDILNLISDNLLAKVSNEHYMAQILSELSR